jgi:3-methyladenine DNA glycosylase AlkD
MLEQLKKELNGLRNDEQAKTLQKFFKTGKGEYAEGDIFLGIKVPIQRDISKKYSNMDLKEIQELLNSKIHEHRFTALLILIKKYQKSKKDRLERRKIFEFYLRNTQKVNNWDLVDLSAPIILGDFLQKEGTDILFNMAQSENMWERRIAIIATYPLIKKRRFGETLAISEILLKDEQDLIHKAVGWMLREIGKRNKKVLELFLMQRHQKMPRVMLRYAIEKFPKEERTEWLKKVKE